MAKTMIKLIPDSSGSANRGNLLNELRPLGWCSAVTSTFSIRISYLPPQTQEVEGLKVTINTGQQLNLHERVDELIAIAKKHGLREK